MEGKLKHWNEAKGFGFISSAEAEDIFIHISALKKVCRRPKVGDTITFQIHTDNNGKKRAINAHILGVSPVTHNREQKNKSNNSKLGVGWLISIIFSVILIFAAYEAYKLYFQPAKQTILSSKTITPINKKKATAVKSNFSCSGKKHCNEMNSCDEAKFYLKNCPDTQMDGDNDGVPCERQWCN